MKRIIEWLKEERHREWLLFGLLAVFMGMKFIYYGVTYFPVLDDWIQYGTYPMHENPFVSVILKAKTYSSRPLAAFFDPYVWGKFWPHMWLVLGVITGCHWLSMLLLYRVLKQNGLKLGWIGLLIYGGLPIGIEASYWISASSRIVFGLFLAIASWSILMSYSQCNQKLKGRGFYLVSYIIVSIASLSFYEQIIPISIIGSVLILFSQRSKLRHKLIYFIPWLNLGVIGLYYAMFMSHSLSASRSGVSLSMIPDRIIMISRTVKTIFIRNQKLLFELDFRRGLDLMLIDRAFVFIGILLLLAFLAFAMTILEQPLSKIRDVDNTMTRENKWKHSEWVKICIGIIFAVLPYTPLLILTAGGWDMRNAFPSLLGLALVVDGLINLIPDVLITRILKGLMISGLIVVFIVVHVSVLSFYKEVSERDKLTGEEIIEIAQESAFAQGEQKLIMFNPRITYSNENYLYGSSIYNATASDWGMTGLLRALTQNLTLPYIYNVPDGSRVSFDEALIEESVLIGIKNDGSVVGLTCSKNEETFVLETLEGEPFGQMIMTDEEFVYTRNPLAIEVKEERVAIVVKDTEVEEELEQIEDLFVADFSVETLNDVYKAWMKGKSYHENERISFDDLKLVNVAYFGFDGKCYQGELVVNKVIAETMVEIFRDLYKVQYPIEKINLIDYYRGDDDLSMVDNNTSAFNYRVIAGSNKLSNHAYGLAIDINPLMNPYVTNHGIFPPEGAIYADRQDVRQGMIVSEDACYKAFTSRGFIWGGDWTRSKDYQHFELWVEGINQ